MTESRESKGPDPTGDGGARPTMTRPVPWFVRLGFSLVVFALVLLVAEGAVRLLGLGAPDPATDPSRGFLPFQSVFVERAGPDGEVRLEVVESRSAMMRRLQFNPQSLPVRKPEGEFRIVCLGGSATYGWPYDDRFSYPRLLEVGLRACAPGTDWRVVNMGAPGYGTTRLRLIAGELSRLESDLVVLTAGNNEALELSFAKQVLGRSRAWTGVLTALARRSRLVSWLVGVGTGLGRRSSDEGEASPGGAIRVDPAQRREVVETFRANVAAMRDLFRASGARVYLSTAPVNQKDCPPFAQDAPGGLQGSRSEDLAGRYARGERLLRDGRTRDAVDTLGALSDELPDSARVRFLYAVALEADGRLDEARRAYRAATDLDPVVLRSFGALREVATDLADEPGVSFVDLSGAMDTASETGIAGRDLFLDNCHPNTRGAGVIALAIARAMAFDGLLPAGGDWEPAFEEGIERYLGEIRISARDRVTALQFLLWYYRVPAPDPGRADEIQAEIERLDPRGEMTSKRFRRALFR